MASENDIVLIHYEDKPLTFARIEQILPDTKPDWYHVKLLLLQVPLQNVTWILRDRYIEGEEFTMSEKRVRLELIPISERTPETGKSRDDAAPLSPPNRSNVISLNHRRKE